MSAAYRPFLGVEQARYTLDYLVAVRAYLDDRRQAVLVAAEQLENANTTYSHADSLDALRRLKATMAGFDALSDCIDADIALSLRQMEGAK
jgi:hypothetical protein